MKAGITGHQNLGSKATIAWLSSVVEDTILQHGINKGFTSLAIGADQLCAQSFLTLGVSYTVVIPSNHYEKTFTDKTALKKYTDLLNKADETIPLSFSEPSEQAFYAAGKKITDLSEIIIAVWNGLPAKGLGGTGDIVKYALSINKKVIHINPINKTISILHQ